MWIARIPEYNYIRNVTIQGNPKIARITYSLATWKWRLFIETVVIELGFYYGDDLETVMREADLVLEKNGYVLAS